MKITVKAAAKINLMLDILEKLPNGYHSLWMIMQSVSVYDRVSVEKKTSGGITISCSEDGIPTDERNIAYKAAEKFFDFCGEEDRNIHIAIEKNIPHAAGLAGGSADGAAVITALNSLYEKNLPVKKLCQIGVKVGADVPFCIQGGTMLAQDIGQVLSQLPDMPSCFFVLAKPQQGVSTAEAYAAVDSINLRHPDAHTMFRSVVDGDLNGIAKSLGNVFEQAVDVHERVSIKEIMRNNDAMGCCMSGSGPTVFGIFENSENAEKCAQELSKKIKGITVHVCTPAEYGCEIEK